MQKMCNSYEVIPNVTLSLSLSLSLIVLTQWILGQLTILTLIKRMEGKVIISNTDIRDQDLIPFKRRRET